MEIQDILVQLGLSNKESGVYLALLELGTASVYPIATKAGIKRPTAYLTLDELQKKGLVSLVPRAGKTLYTAQSPETLLSDLNKKQELVKRFMPNMLALYNVKTDKPQVQLFEGKQAVRALYDKLLTAKNVEFFSTIRDILHMFPDYPPMLNRQALSGKVVVRELLTKSAGDVAYANSMQHNKYFMQRFAKGGGEFITDNCLYDGNVVFFSYEPCISAVQITSLGIYKSVRNLFEYAWNAAEEIAT